MSLTRTNEPNDRLFELDRDLSQMAALVESQLQRAITAFERREIASAERIISGDQRVDSFFLGIDSTVLTMLAEGRLSETELRRVIAIMKISGELERVGDLAKNVAKRTIVICREMSINQNSGVARMGRASLRQLSDILTAYSTQNLAAAKAVWVGDDELDQLYNSVFSEIISVIASDPVATSSGVHLVFIAKNFERVGDHATNIAEAIHYIKTGVSMPESRPKSDNTASVAFTTDEKRGT